MAVTSALRGFSAIRAYVITPIFGLVLPFILLMQSFHAIGSISSDAHFSDHLKSIIQALPEKAQKLEGVDDYLFTTAVIMEVSLQRATSDRQKMRVAIINIGFATMCIGMLFVFFGVGNSMPMVLATENAALGKVNVKVASAGLATFVCGALMATLGGALRSQYKTIDFPPYGGAAAGYREAVAQGPETREELEGLAMVCIKHTKGLNNLSNCLTQATITGKEK